MILQYTPGSLRASHSIDLKLGCAWWLGLTGVASLLCEHPFGRVGEDLVDERLVADTSSACFLAGLIEHARIDADRDPLSGFVTERRAADSSHRLQLLC